MSQTTQRPPFGPYVVELLAKRIAANPRPKRCDCGRIATRLGTFAYGADPAGNGFALCEVCAGLVDRGVRLMPLDEARQLAFASKKGSA
jgi:hypothetical protein